MMKTIKYFILLGAVGMMSLFTACEKNLELNPELSIDYDLVYVDEEGVKLALDGAWSILGSPNLYAGTSVFQSDLLGADGSSYLVWDGTFAQWRNMYRKSLNKNESTVSAKWIVAYRAINILNNVLANLDKVDTDPDRVEGEAKFLRGILYFELVRFYAQPYGFTAGNTHNGVPLVLTPVQTYEDITFPARATVGAVYTQILNDLGDAKDLLNPGRAGANRGLATSTNASAFLARVYFSQKDWANTAAEATIVIDEFGPDALNATPRACFNNIIYTSEDVFMIRQSLTSNAGQANDGITTFFASLPGLGRGDVRIQAAQISLFEAGDLRGGLEDNPDARVINEISKMYYWGYGTRAGRRRTTKWGDYKTNVPVIRLAEMYLTRAEANFMDGTSVGDTPINDLNKIRARANASLIAAPGDIDLDLIKLDRYKELCFEGHALHDLKRWQGSILTPSGSVWGAGVVLNWDDWRLVHPIPQREIEVNPALVQNTNY
jgi:starch-binding outer membrane protein, SusD/RagB family